MIGVLVSWGAIEVFALVASWVATGAPPDLAAPRDLRRSLLVRIASERPDPGLEAFPGDVVHPYLGFVGNPLQTPAPGEAPVRRNAFGFADPEDPIRARGPDRFVVALLGGSVAERFGRYGAARLADRLQALGVADGRRVEIVRLGQSGYKQPQQLLTIAWLMSLGAGFDAVIALDGFNEVALHGAENARQGVEPSYPRAWSMRVAGLPDAAALAQRGRVGYLDRARAGWAAPFTTPPLRWSPTAHVIWRWRDRVLRREQVEAEAWLRGYRPSEDRYAVRGPAYFRGADGSPENLVALWERSSLQLHRLVRADGGRYFHFLQPNQYFPGTKPMGAAERAVAFREDHPYRAGAEAAYALLVAAGERLRAAGVAFDDASAIFSDVHEAVFVDDCCHMSPSAHQRIADHIAEYVASVLAQAAPPG